MMFLKPGIRRSLISKMLTEILDTRVMIKKSIKLVKADDNVGQADMPIGQLVLIAGSSSRHYLSCSTRANLA